MHVKLKGKHAEQITFYMKSEYIFRYDTVGLNYCKTKLTAKLSVAERALTFFFWRSSVI